MSGNVTVFGDIADKFDALVAYDEKLLDNWVEEQGYSTTSMVLASTAMAFMTFAKGFVDVGRLGNGMLIESGWKGAGKDVLRALNVAGGAGAALSRGARILRSVQFGNSCTWFSQTNAVRLAGHRFFLSVEELARRAGVNLGTVAASGSGASEYSAMVSALRAMGIPVRQLAAGAAMSLDDVANLVRANPGGVITFTILAKGAGMAHRLYATWSRLGGLVIRDPNFLFRTYRSAAEVLKHFGQGTVVTEREILFVANTLLTDATIATQTLGGLGALVSQVIPLVTVPAKDDETALQAMIVHEQVAATGVPAAPQSGAQSPAGKWHTVQQGDWLSNIAKHYYGNMWKWPVIYVANRKTIGGNPDLIRPGQRLFIPNLPDARIIAARSVPGHFAFA